MIDGTLNLLPIVKNVLLVAGLIYGMFAFITVRQVGLMHKTFETSMGPLFKLLAYIHLFAVVAAVVLALLLL